MSSQTRQPRCDKSDATGVSLEDRVPIVEAARTVGQVPMCCGRRLAGSPVDAAAAPSSPIFELNRTALHVWWLSADPSGDTGREVRVVTMRQR
jgi:hypothetical protein